jgi:ADP-ribosyl-[dinitrogen reductase] hydrolase
MICRALGGQTKEAVLLGDAGATFGSPKVSAIARGEYEPMPERDIRGTGYVVESLQAAAWCFARTDTYEAPVLRAANLGDDADTTAAVCGQLAGAFYGECGIPGRWLMQLAMRDQISSLAERLYTKGV